MTEAEQSKRCRILRIKTGRCIQCCKPRDTEVSSYCKACRKKYRLISRKRQGFKGIGHQKNTLEKRKS